MLRTLHRATAILDHLTSETTEKKQLMKNQTLSSTVFYVSDLKDQFKWKKLDFHDKFKEIKQTWDRLNRKESPKF